MKDYISRACCVIFMVLVTIAAVFTAYAAYYAGLAHRPPQPLPSIIDIQRAVGAKPDGIVGPDTIEKWEAAYANQEAAKFFTLSGAPKE